MGRGKSLKALFSRVWRLHQGWGLAQDLGLDPVYTVWIEAKDLSPHARDLQTQDKRLCFTRVTRGKEPGSQWKEIRAHLIKEPLLPFNEKTKHLIKKLGLWLWCPHARSCRGVWNPWHSRAIWRPSQRGKLGWPGTRLPLLVCWPWQHHEQNSLAEAECEQYL